MKIIILAILLVLVPSGQACECYYMQPQEKICRDDFVGIIEINVAGATGNFGPGIVGRAKIIKVLKGKYEEFRPGDVVYIYSKAGACALDMWLGKQIVSGKSHQGGLRMDQCSFRELHDYFTPQQIAAIDSHIRKKSYVNGCSFCSIKKQYDMSTTKVSECRDVYEFPAQTSACVRKNDGKCDWVDFSRTQFQQTGPRDFTTSAGSVPTESVLENATPTSSTQHTTTTSVASSDSSSITLLQTTQPPTTQPRTTQPRTTQPRTTQPPTSQSPTTQPPTTQPPTTQPPTTQPPTTQSSTTHPPTTHTPTTLSITGATTTKTTRIQVFLSTTLPTTTTQRQTKRSTTMSTIRRQWIHYVRLSVTWPPYSLRKRS